MAKKKSFLFALFNYLSLVFIKQEHDDWRIISLFANVEHFDILNHENLIPDSRERLCNDLRDDLSQFV